MIVDVWRGVRSRLWRDRAKGAGWFMKYFVYILKSGSGERFYVGQTQDVEERLKRHNSGNNSSTKYGVPRVVVYKEEFASRSDAFRREQQIKRYKGGAAFKKLLG